MSFCTYLPYNTFFYRFLPKKRTIFAQYHKGYKKDRLFLERNRRSFRLSHQDSNLDKQNQKLLCYHYTMRQSKLSSKSDAKIVQPIKLCKFSCKFFLRFTLQVPDSSSSFRVELISIYNSADRSCRAPDRK